MLFAGGAWGQRQCGAAWMLGNASVQPVLLCTFLELSLEKRAQLQARSVTATSCNWQRARAGQLGAAAGAQARPRQPPHQRKGPLCALVSTGPARWEGVRLGGVELSDVVSA